MKSHRQQAHRPKDCWVLPRCTRRKRSIDLNYNFSTCSASILEKFGRLTPYREVIKPTKDHAEMMLFTACFGTCTWRDRRIVGESYCSPVLWCMSGQDSLRAGCCCTAKTTDQCDWICTSSTLASSSEWWFWVSLTFCTKFFQLECEFPSWIAVRFANNLGDHRFRAHT